MTDELRFQYTMRRIIGWRLTDAELTGKTEEGSTGEAFREDDKGQGRE